MIMSPDVVQEIRHRCDIAAARGAFISCKISAIDTKVDIWMQLQLPMRSGDHSRAFGWNASCDCRPNSAVIEPGGRKTDCMRSNNCPFSSAEVGL
jgi:hypothetical protein